MQKEFTENDLSSDVSFLNIFYKRYHKLLEALRHGQLCLLPQDANNQFAGVKVLCTGCVSVVQSGNERGVNQCKMFWLIKRGCHDHQWDINFLSDVWEAFTYRINFMSAEVVLVTHQFHVPDNRNLSTSD
jgi:hypothetical protein